MPSNCHTKLEQNAEKIPPQVALVMQDRCVVPCRMIELLSETVLASMKAMMGTIRGAQLVTGTLEKFRSLLQGALFEIEEPATICLSPHIESGPGVWHLGDLFHVNCNVRFEVQEIK